MLLGRRFDVGRPDKKPIYAAVDVRLCILISANEHI